MSYRRQVSKPCAALWLLVAVADLALLAAGIGMAGTLMVLGAVATAAVVAVGGWKLARRAGAAAAPMPAPAPMRRTR